MQEELRHPISMNLYSKCASGVYIIYLLSFLVVSQLIFNSSLESLNLQPAGIKSLTISNKKVL